MRLRDRSPATRAPVASRRNRLFLIVAALVGTACGSDAAPRAPETPPDTAPAAETGSDGERVYERALTFTTLETDGSPAETTPGDTTAADTALVATFHFLARADARSTRRSLGGWIALGDAWERFASLSSEGPPSRTPWRLLPTGPVRLVVGTRGAVETLVYRDPPRILELDLGEELAGWTDSRGSTYRLESSTVLLGSRRFEGLTLDVTRAWDADALPPGDWGLLVSGDSLQLVLQAPERSPPGTAGAFRGYGRVDFRRLQWSDLTVEWSRPRAFEPARRDVPGGLRIGGGGSGPTGELDVVGADLSAGEGEGPVMPVEALFTLRGVVELEGNRYPVHGFFRHVRE